MFDEELDQFRKELTPEIEALLRTDLREAFQILAEPAAAGVPARPTLSPEPR